MAKTFGGIVRFLIQGREILKLTGSYSMDLSAFTYESAANANGSLDRTAKFEGFTAEVTVRVNDGQEVVIDDIMALEGLDIQFILETERRVVTFFGASLIGKAKQDRMTGEISGLSLQAPRYNVVPL